MTWQNKCVLEFNKAPKNRKAVQKTSAFAFISCPDFSHVNGKYDFVTIRNGLPLSFSLALEQLLLLAQEKPIQIYISDHEAEKPEIQGQLCMTTEQILEAINGSLETIQKHFPEASFLSTLYPYSKVVKARHKVPQKYFPHSALSPFGPERPYWYDNLIYAEVEKYAQVITFLKACQKNNFCPIFLYRNSIFTLVADIRKELQVPVLFLDIESPH